MPETFAAIFKKSWSSFRGHLSPIVISALIFGVALYSAQILLTHSAMGTVEERFSGLSARKMQEYSQRIQQGDQQAMQEMMADMGHMGQGRFILSLMPVFSLYFVVAYLLSVIAVTYYLVLALQKKKSDDALAQTPKYILPILGVWIWSFMRSFAWIPFIGVIPAIILGPRFAFSGVILVKEQKGIMESVTLSYERTRGYWGRVTGHLFLMGLCIFGVAIVSVVVLGMIGLFAPLLKGVLSATLTYCYMAFGVIFTVYLADTIMRSKRA